MLLRFFLIRLLPAVLALTVTGCTGADPLTVSNARVRQVIPGQDKTAAYLDLRNTGDAAVTIIGAESDAARAVEMHTTVHDGDQVRMKPLSEVVVPAGQTVRFEPGGRHLMLFGVSNLGDHIDVILKTRDGRRVQVRFETVGYGAD